MVYKVKFEGPHDLPSRVVREIERALSSVAEAGPAVIADRIEDRRKPDGSPQRALKQSTIDRKGHDHPLTRSEGFPLQNGWTWKKIGRFMYEIEPDESRVVTIGHLQKLGFQISGEDKALSALLDVAFRDLVRRLEQI